MITKIFGALMRAGLVGLLIATPSLLLSPAGADTTQIVVLIALFASLLTFYEYTSSYPSIVEFRDAQPFNRIRFSSLLFTVFLLSAIMRGQVDPSGVTVLTQTIDKLVSKVIDFPYSPVRLLLLTLPDTTSAELCDLIRTTAGISYLVSLLSLVIFVLLLRLFGWPSRDNAFNLWVNLPFFDPSNGDDVIAKLQRNARINIGLGVLLPFIIPTFIGATNHLFGGIPLDSPQTLVWTMTVWAFLPASLCMRGIAMGRIAHMIANQRRRTGPAGADGTMLVVS